MKIHILSLIAPSLLLTSLHSVLAAEASVACTNACDDYLLNLENTYNIDNVDVINGGPINTRDVGWICTDGSVLTCLCCHEEGLSKKETLRFLDWATVCATAQVHGNLAGAECWNSNLESSLCITKVNCN